MQLTLNEDQIKKIDSFIGEIPAKYSLPLIQFLSSLVAQQNRADQGKPPTPIQEAEVVSSEVSKPGRRRKVVQLATK